MKLPDPRSYRTLIFDCDGVLLNSNRVKTDAFRSVAMSYGEEPARRLVRYHLENGGVSRYRKFDYFLREIVGVAPTKLALQELLDAFAREVRNGLLTCAVAPSLQLLRGLCERSRWAVVSGGDQAELRTIFDARELTAFFDGGVYGSPETKEVIVEREIAAGTIVQPALFFGDSKYDHEIANFFNLDFLFVSEWSEFSEWKAYQACHGFPTVSNLHDLLTAFSTMRLTNEI